MRPLPTGALERGGGAWWGARGGVGMSTNVPSWPSRHAPHGTDSWGRYTRSGTSLPPTSRQASSHAGTSTPFGGAHHGRLTPPPTQTHHPPRSDPPRSRTRTRPIRRPRSRWLGLQARRGRQMRGPPLHIGGTRAGRAGSSGLPLFVAADLAIPHEALADVAQDQPRLGCVRALSAALDGLGDVDREVEALGGSLFHAPKCSTVRHDSQHWSAYKG